MPKRMILGGGVTGLAAGVAGGGEVYEATPNPGGICASYYIRPGSTDRLHEPPADGNAYRFEIGGGHWIFGGDPAVLKFIQDLTPCETYARVSSVYLPDERIYAPFPIQNHLRALGPERAARALEEMSHPSGEVTTMKAWLRRNFGKTLFEAFFDGFNRLYTAGLYDRIAPQDAYKSPVNLELVRQGATGDAPAVGYNTKYLYPREGLGTLAARMAERCTVHFGKRAMRIDPQAKRVEFEHGSGETYDRLLATLPLDALLRLSGITVPERADPYTSVLVLNIGAARGARCPDDHWVYVPASRARFHRVGFYSHVSPSFLPKSHQAKKAHTSIYVERAYPGGQRPDDAEVGAYCSTLVSELQEWGYIGEVEAIDPTWIDSAYTWSWPGSTWRDSAMKALEAHGIHPVGRYARWIFQGIADSIRDGFGAGKSVSR